MSGTEDDTNVYDLIYDADPDIQCYEKVSDYHDFIMNTRFWLEGVLLPIFGGIGLLGNAVSIFILRRCTGSRNFNILLCW